MRKFFIKAIVLCFWLFLGSQFSSVHLNAQSSCPPGEAIVATDKGCVRGESLGSLKVFRGIPYAAPPVGTLRWKISQPHEPWDGVRDASSFGKSCPQLRGSILPVSVATDEDCLFLNVWTTGTDPAANLPVMFWIHGGGLVQGSSSQITNDGRATYDGRFLAEKGQLVVVSINYRLAQLGFLAHPALSAEDKEHGVSGNYGLLDQLFALRWVQKNIKNFGGNSQNVTIFGESAGGKSVCGLLASPLAAGLSHRAIIESGGCLKVQRHLKEATPAAPESAEAQGERYARAIGCANTPDVLACLRSKTPQEILSVLPGEASIISTAEKYDFTIDNYALNEAPGVVPLIAGTNGNEASIFTTNLAITTQAQFEAFVRAFFKNNADQVLALYPVSNYPRVKDALDALVADVSFVCPTRQFTRAVQKYQPKTYLYQFTYVTRIGNFLGIGAFHGSEIEYVFGILTSLATPQEQALSDAMITYWTNFAKTGDPNSAATAVTWPTYTFQEDPHLQLDIPISAGHELHKKQCDLLGSLQGSN
ncbi:carboxylesterase family protein [Candidatus Acetothermia bacterium]|nr:carboxylesterase family protein [Candidatus Acetothermia bacterium]